jgi:hypothetical protein
VRTVPWAALLLGLALSGCASDTVTATPPASATPSSTSEATDPPGLIEPANPPPAGTVPRGALLKPVDLGPGWSSAPAAPPRCAPAQPPGATRSAGYAEARGRLSETVRVGWEVPPAVTAWRAALRRCGFTVGDLALGDSGLLATSSSAVVIVTGTEGVLVVLHATGGLAQAREELEGWADLALGTSCGAAPDGCH